MNKGLKALENIKREVPSYFSTLYDIDMWREDIGIIEKELIKLSHIEYIVKKIYEVSFVAIDFTGKRTYTTIRINDKNDLKSMIDYLVENSPTYDIVVLGIKEK